MYLHGYFIYFFLKEAPLQTLEAQVSYNLDLFHLDIKLLASHLRQNLLDLESEDLNLSHRFTPQIYQPLIFLSSFYSCKMGRIKS